MSSKAKMRFCRWIFCLIVCLGAFGLSYTGKIGDVWMFSLSVVSVLIATGLELKDVADSIKRIGPGGIEFRDEEENCE
jgi:hypothetical protein